MAVATAEHSALAEALAYVATLPLGHRRLGEFAGGMLLRLPYRWHVVGVLMPPAEDALEPMLDALAILCPPGGLVTHHGAWGSLEVIHVQWPPVAQVIPWH